MSNRRQFLTASLLVTLSPEALAREQSTAQMPIANKNDSVAQNAPWLEKIAKQLCDEFNVPAVWLAGGAEGVIDLAAVGVRKAGNPTKVSLNDRLMIGSISKPMTGLWLASLVEKGRLNYTTKLLEVLPEMSKDCLPEHRNILLSQLVTHTAKLESQADNWVVDTNHPENYPKERLRFGREVLRKPSPPGSETGSFYSNAGFTLAGAMGERCSGSTYEQAITTFYREVIALSSWGLGEPNLRNDLTGAWPHEIRNGVPQPFQPTNRHYIGAQPSGGAHCTIGDLARFGQFILQGYRGAGRVLKRDTWRQILAPIPNVAFNLCGFSHATWDVITFHHEGGVGGGSSELWLLPEEKLVFAVHYTTSWLEGNSKYLERAHELVVDQLRQQRGQALSPHCEVVLTRVITVDATGNEISVKRSDGKVRVAIELEVRGTHSGDIKIWAKLGDHERQANYFRGLSQGQHRAATFEWDIPVSASTPFIAIVDACHSCGDKTSSKKRFAAPLAVES